MKQVISNYKLLTEKNSTDQIPMGDSVSPKEMIFHIVEDNTQPTQVLDIGFGTGGLGKIIKDSNETNHWEVDGIDGWEVNCQNQELFGLNIYRNIWHGLAQELPQEVITQYDIICLLDVIEHLNAESAKALIYNLLNSMGASAHLFVSTPLWFYPQSQQQDGDLEEHLIGVPVSSMMAMLPTMYSINEPLVGGFVYGKKSLDYVDFFQPTSNKDFSYHMGQNMLKLLNIEVRPGILFKTNPTI